MLKNTPGDSPGFSESLPPFAERARAVHEFLAPPLQPVCSFAGVLARKRGIAISPRQPDLILSGNVERGGIAYVDVPLSDEPHEMMHQGLSRALEHGAEACIVLPGMLPPRNSTEALVHGKRFLHEAVLVGARMKYGDLPPEELEQRTPDMMREYAAITTIQRDFKYAQLAIQLLQKEGVELRPLLTDLILIAALPDMDAVQNYLLSMVRTGTSREKAVVLLRATYLFKEYKINLASMRLVPYLNDLCDGTFDLAAVTHALLPEKLLEVHLPYSPRPKADIEAEYEALRGRGDLLELSSPELFRLSDLYAQIIFYNNVQAFTFVMGPWYLWDPSRSAKPPSRYLPHFGLVITNAADIEAARKKPEKVLGIRAEAHARHGAAYSTSNFVLMETA